MSRRNYHTSFFLATQNVHRRIGHTCSFVWANYASLEELWWQVRGHRKIYPTLHIDKVRDKFLGNAILPGGVDLKLLCIDTDWETHREEYARWLVLEMCTIYEEWAEKVCQQVFQDDKYKKWMQFPKQGKEKCVHDVVATARLATSPIMCSEFYPIMSAHRNNIWTLIDEYLTAYRYFKVCRNAIIHSDGLVTPEVHQWQKQLLITNSRRGIFRKHFQVTPSSVNDRINIGTSNAVLFAALIRRLTMTLDAELCVNITAEKMLKDRLADEIARKPSHRQMPKDQHKQDRRVENLLIASRIPKPQSVRNIYQWMRQEKLVF